MAKQLGRTSENIRMPSFAFAPAGTPGTVTITGLTYPISARVLVLNVVVGKRGKRLSKLEVSEPPKSWAVPPHQKVCQQ
jgi:hypothetical protein